MAKIRSKQVPVALVKAQAKSNTRSKKRKKKKPRPPDLRSRVHIGFDWNGNWVDNTYHISRNYGGE